MDSNHDLGFRRPLSYPLDDERIYKYIHYIAHCFKLYVKMVRDKGVESALFTEQQRQIYSI